MYICFLVLKNFMDDLIRHIPSNLADILGFYKILAILGPRQVGKTTFAKQITGLFPERTFEYIDLESSEDSRKLDDAETWLKQQEGKTVIIDEVQQRPELFGLLRSVVDKRKEKGQFILLGSASPDLIQKSGQTLAGRIHYLYLSPFSLREIGYENMKLHWVRGGYPESWFAPSDALSVEWRKDYLDSFVYRDLAAMGLSFTPATMQRLFQMTAHVHGGVLNKSTLANSLGISQPSVSSYIDILAGAFMVHLLQPYHLNVGKRLVKSPKLYLCDSGLLHALLFLSNYNTLLGHPQSGNSWEGYVIEEIIKATGQAWQYYFYRTHNGAECDLFCITGNGKRIAIEIKLTNSPSISKGFFQSIADLEPDVSYVITPDVMPYTQKDGITITGLEWFLRDIGKM